MQKTWRHNAGVILKNMTHIPCVKIGVPLIAILSLLFYANSAYASVLLFHSSTSYDTGCTSNPNTGAYPVFDIYNLPTGYFIGSASFIVSASSTVSSKLSVYKNGVPLGYATSTVTVTPTYTVWNLSQVITEPIEYGDVFRFAVYGDETPPYTYRQIVWGTVATTSNIIMTGLYGNENFNCTSLGAPSIQLQTESFSSAVQSPIYYDDVFKECGLTAITGCFVNAFQWAFVPPSTAFDSFATLKDEIKNKPPFGYFTSAVNTFETLNASATPAFALASVAPINALIFTPIRTGLSWLIVFAGLLWLYKRLTHIQI